MKFVCALRGPQVVTAAKGAPYASLSLRSKRGPKGFDVVATEFFDGRKVDGGLLEIAEACAARGWLAKQGSFIPKRVKYWAAPADARLPGPEAFGGVDLRLFDRFRGAGFAAHDLTDEFGADASGAASSAGVA